MTAYWINTFTEIRDLDLLERYAALAGPAMVAAGGRFLATLAVLGDGATREIRIIPALQERLLRPART